MNYKERLAKINERISEIDKMLETADEKALDELDKESKELVAARAKLMVERQTQIRKDFTDSTSVEQPKITQEEVEKRVRELLQGRSISIGSLDILHIEHKSDTMNPAFKPVSGLIDMIPVTSLPGGETYAKAFMKTYGIGGYTAEGVAATVSEPTYGYADIKKTKITAYTEVSEEFEKLAPSMYLEEIKRNLNISLKKRLAMDVLKGAGTTNTLVGIFSSNATAIEAAKDLEVVAIDENTLDDIIFAFGGDEELAPGILILSKADLKSFSKVRGTNEKKRAYTIDYKNQTIDGIPYVISGAITPLAQASVGDYVMAFGSLSNYTLTSFSPVEVTKSVDYKFKEGQIAYKAVGFFGGNVTSFNGDRKSVV